MSEWLLFLYWLLDAAAQNPLLTAHLWLRLRILCGI